ncbi:DNA polymerase delta subunit 4 [Vitis vinifera]|uniref:DNA polymerase delta subunit 4 n=1 Tax=Vitis vinifera TaxID=29760 RepID=A0A438C8P9_VITVI|nr:DNA polymerase delta subunit 4 [Vitis vinifera]
MASGNMKGYFKQKKSGGGRGIAKPKPSKKSTKILPTHVATLGSDVVQPSTLSAHDLQDDEYDGNETVLRQFDMNMAYGPCLGMSRLARWERAQRLGLNPPKEIETLLKQGKARADCLWDGCV